VDVPALPLQLLLRGQPAWRDHPVVVVEHERPLAKVLWLNRQARQVGICRGMSFSQAQTLSARLRAAVIPSDEVQSAVQQLFQLLILHSPLVEPDGENPGLFWLDPNGLKHLFGGYQQWACQLHRALAEQGYVTKVVVGFHRYLIFAIARTIKGTLVLADSQKEQNLAHRVRLDRLDLPSTLCAELSCLGIDTIGRFLQLKPNAIRVRFGVQAARLHGLANGELWTPLMPHIEHAPLRVEREVDPAENDRNRLLFLIKNTLQQPMEQLVEQCEAITGLILVFTLDHAPPHREEIETAAPTLNLLLIVDLIRLRLATTSWDAPVERIAIELNSVRVHPMQLSLLQRKNQRDLEAAARALARVKAAFGADSATRARLRKAYLPEASFAWEPISQVQAPRPVSISHEPPLIRRFCAARELISTGADISLGQLGRTARQFGPFRVAGGWWRRRVERDYYFVESEYGQILWVYYDRPRRFWVLHGTVE